MNGKRTILSSSILFIGKESRMAQDRDLLEGYRNIKILKTTKQQLRVKGMLYLTDAIIILIGLIAPYLLGEFFRLPMLYRIMMMILSGLFSTFLCMKPVEYGGERNIVLIFRLLKMNRETRRAQTLSQYLDREKKGV